MVSSPQSLVQSNKNTNHRLKSGLVRHDGKHPATTVVKGGKQKGVIFQVCLRGRNVTKFVDVLERWIERALLWEEFPRPVVPLPPL